MQAVEAVPSTAGEEHPRFCSIRGREGSGPGGREIVGRWAATLAVLVLLAAPWSPLGAQSLGCTTVSAEEAVAPIHVRVDTEGKPVSDLKVDIREDSRLASEEHDRALRFSVAGMRGGLNCSGDHLKVELNGPEWGRAGTTVLTVNPDSEVTVSWTGRGRDTVTSRQDAVVTCRLGTDRVVECSGDASSSENRRKEDR